MGFIKLSIIISGIVLLGIAAVTAQVPEFKSGASTSIDHPVNLDLLYQKAEDFRFDVVKYNETLLVYQLKDTTHNWAYVSGDGKILVASTSDFEFASMDTLKNQSSGIIDLIKTAGVNISDNVRNNALDGIAYYGNYHSLIYPFSGNCEIYLVVPNCTIEAAQFTVDGSSHYRGECSTCDQGQQYYINGTEIASCSRKSRNSASGYCSVPQANITDMLHEGAFKISSENIDEGEQMTMYIEIVTSTKPEEPFVLHGPNSEPWITEMPNSYDLEALRKATYLDV